MTVPAFFRNPQLPYRVWQSAQARRAAFYSDNYVESYIKFLLDGEYKYLVMVHSYSPVPYKTVGQLFIRFSFNHPCFAGQVAKITYSEKSISADESTGPLSFNTTKYKRRQLPRFNAETDDETIDHYFNMLLLSLSSATSSII